MENVEIIELLKKEMIPAMGCTEPGASALAGARASELLGEEVIKAEISASGDMLKNAMGVGLPGCDLKGITAAVALGIVKKDTSQGLNILSEVLPDQIEKAQKIKTTLTLAKNVPPLYVAVKVYGKIHTAKAVVANRHDRFSLQEKDDNVISELEISANCSDKETENSIAASLTLEEIVKFADSVKAEELDFVKKAVETNTAIAEHSLKGEFGLKVGKTMFAAAGKEETLSNAYNRAAAKAAAGSDARMSGCSMSVIINSGSGNQGITVTVPVAVVGQYLNLSREKILRAVCIAELSGLALTARKDRLSALCGAFTASIGTACAYVYLSGGSLAQMDKAVNTMVGNLAGIICDGAKNTCALKIYSCLQAAAMAAVLAMNDIGPGRESGIVGADSFESVKFLSEISSKGMKQTDRTILSIMLEKN